MPAVVGLPRDTPRGIYRWTLRSIRVDKRETGDMEYMRITVDPAQVGGVPCIRGLRIPVATVVALLAEGADEQEILGDYPDLEPEDIREALRYAAEAVRERELPLAAGQ